jgi:uncharacterized cupredoxin-like copper-binding protein
MRTTGMLRKRTAATLIALLALAGTLLLSACGGGDEVEPVAESSAEEPAAERSAEPASQPSDAAPAREVTVRMGEMFFKPDQRRLKAGKVTVKARNVGDVEHDIVMVQTDLPADEMPMTPEGGPDYERAGHVMFGGHGGGGHGAEGGDDIHVMPGHTERVQVTLEPGEYVLVCTYSGHYQAGQQASLKVVR